MEISLEALKELRSNTAAPVSECKKALLEADGDIKKAESILRKRGLQLAAAKQARVTKEGRVESYIHHGNKIGVLLELSCESDFVAKNSDFSRFAKDVAMQVAATCPGFVAREDVPEDVISAEADKEQFFKANCLLEQPFIKDPSMTINDYLGSQVAKLGEKILVRRFVRYQIGK